MGVMFSCFAKVCCLLPANLEPETPEVYCPTGSYKADTLVSIHEDDETGQDISDGELVLEEVSEPSEISIRVPDAEIDEDYYSTDWEPPSSPQSFEYFQRLNQSENEDWN